MRLENDDEAAMPQLSCGLEGRPHLGRMVRVVVVDRRALKNAEKFEPAARAREALEGPGHFGEAVRDSSGGRFERERALVIGAKEGDAVGGKRGYEPGEQVLDLIDILEMVGMVELDVGHDRALGVVED